mgnify:CR=1 FL=1
MNFLKFKKIKPRYLFLFLIGFLVLVAIELGAILYVNNVYLRENDHYRVTRINSSSSGSVKHHTLSLPSDAKSISVSHDGNYLAYLENGQIKIADMQSGSTSSVSAEKNRSISYFKWVYDRDRLTIVEKGSSVSSSSHSQSSTDKNGSSRTSSDSSTSTNTTDYFAELYSYDMSDKTTQLVRDYMNNKDVHIALNSPKDTITGMDMSTETVVTYLKITSTTGRSRLWEANVTVQNAALPDLPTHTIGNIQSLKSTNDLLFEDSDSGQVYQYNATDKDYTPLSINGNTSLRLLGFDQSEKVYVGIMNGGKVTSIAYGDLSKNNWAFLTPPSAVDPADLSVTYDGKVYYNNAPAQTMSNLSDNTSTPYSGTVLGSYTNGFYALKDNTVTDNHFPS